jgi:hypothetical protein
MTYRMKIVMNKKSEKKRNTTMKTIKEKIDFFEQWFERIIDDSSRYKFDPELNDQIINLLIKIQEEIRKLKITDKYCK